MRNDNLVRIDGDYDGVYERQVTLQAGQMISPYLRFEAPWPHTALYTSFLGHVRATYPVLSWQANTGNWSGTDEHLYGTEHPSVSEESGWRHTYPAATPPMRQGYAMAYDSDRGRTIILR